VPVNLAEAQVLLAKASWSTFPVKKSNHVERLRLPFMLTVWFYARHRGIVEVVDG
jgi:hypothetical protein